MAPESRNNIQSVAAEGGPSHRGGHHEPVKLEIHHLSDVLGAEITNVDLRLPMSEALKAAILDAFHQHHLLVFRGQKLTPEGQYAFSENFGVVESNVSRRADGSILPVVHEVSNVTKQPYVKGNYFWHSDKSYYKVPALATILHAIELPPKGGDTQFANMALALEALPEDERRSLESVHIVHDLAQMCVVAGYPVPPEVERRDAPPVAHPLLRTHPATGRKGLYIGMYCASVVGMDEAEGKKLLARLSAHADQDRFIYTHRWQPGDLIIWDNRCLLHRSVANFDMEAEQRVLRRTVVRGTVPY